MLIAIDYDGTYTAEPALFDRFIDDARRLGHTVMCVTMRHESEPVECLGVDRIIYTGRKAKAPFLASLGLKPSIWIDDSPGWIFSDAP